MSAMEMDVAFRRVSLQEAEWGRKRACGKAKKLSGDSGQNNRAASMTNGQKLSAFDGYADAFEANHKRQA